MTAMHKLKQFLVQKIPYLSILFTLLLCLCAAFFHQHDKQLWEEINEQYQHSLLTIEKPIYEDFIRRRLAIERIGSLEYLAQLEQYLINKDNEQLSRMILNDQAFFPYVKREGHIFLSSKQYQYWLDTRSIIMPVFNGLSKQRFAVSKSHFTLASLLTYPLTSSHTLPFLFNIVLFFILAIFIEYKLKLFKLSFLIFVTSLSSATSYIAMSSYASLPLQGLSAIVFGLFTAYFLEYTWRDRGKPHHKLHLLFTCLVTIALLASTYYSYLSKWVDLTIISSGLFSMLVVLLLTKLNYFLSGLAITQQSLTHSDNQQENDWKFRTALSVALESIAQFKFAHARKALKALSLSYPNSSTLLEQRYHLEKLQPDDGDYWRCANELIQISVKKQDYPKMVLLFNDIQKNAASKERARTKLKPDSYHKMMMVFVKHDDMNKAEQAFLFLELAGQTTIIRDACLLLVQEFKLRNMQSKQQQYQMLFERL
jgi:membrane associated rhomboid family serine protease